MPRYERNGTFWEIRLEGNVFHVTSDGKTTTRKFIGEEPARVQYDKAIAQRVAEGFREVEDVVVREERRDEDAYPAPDDLDALAVAGDALTQREDFRGELIALHLAIHRLRDAADEDTVEERHKLARTSQRVLAAHQEEIFGPLASLARSVTDGGVAVKRSGPLVATWRLGVIDAARISAGGAMSVGEIYMELRTLPAAEHIRELSFGPTVPSSERAAGFSFEVALDALEKHGAPSRLRSLVFDATGVRGDELPWTTPAEVDAVTLGRVARVFPLTPELERLALVGGRAELAGAGAPPLRAVELYGGSATLENLEWLAEAGAVEELLFMPSQPEITLSEVLSRVAPMPLRALTVRGCPFGSPADLVDFPGLTRLARLDVAANGLRDEGAEVIRGAAARFAHLEHLDVRQNNFSQENVRALRAALPNARAYGQFDVEFDEDGGVDALFDALRE